MRIICIDFDGVIHSYTSGWQGADVANDPPVPGAREFIVALCESEECVAAIYSARSKEPGGIECMQRYLVEQVGLGPEYMDAIEFPKEKPAANMTIDDRCFRFEGDFPSLGWIRRFRPWNK